MDELEQPASLDSDAAGTTAAEDHNTAETGHDEHEGLDLDSQEQTEEEDDEIEVDGKKFALPKSAAAKLNAERLMQADYTQKTQAVAEERKAIAAEREAVQRHQQQAQQFISELAKVTAIDEQLAQYHNLDWTSLIDEDPQGAMKLQQQQRTLEAQRAQVAQAITQKQNEHALNEQQAIAKQVQEAEAYMAREIPGINPERVAAIQKYATTHGIDERTFFQTIVKQPQFAVAMHKAELFDQLAKKQTAKPQAPAAPPAPVTRVGAARAAAKVDPAKMSDAQWYAQRERERKR